MKGGCTVSASKLKINKFKRQEKASTSQTETKSILQYCGIFSYFLMIRKKTPTGFLMRFCMQTPNTDMELFFPSHTVLNHLILRLLSKSTNISALMKLKFLRVMQKVCSTLCTVNSPSIITRRADAVKIRSKAYYRISHVCTESIAPLQAANKSIKVSIYFQVI